MSPYNPAQLSNRSVSAQKDDNASLVRNCLAETYEVIIGNEPIWTEKGLLIQSVINIYDKSKINCKFSIWGLDHATQ